MKDIILKAQELYFSYDDENTHSLNGLSLEIQRGKKVAFMGANGSGKSTFFLCCNGIHRPSSGTLFVDGKPIDYSKKGLLDLRQKVGIVFQDPDNQLFSASVYQEISFGILNLGISEEEAQKEAENEKNEKVSYTQEELKKMSVNDLKEFAEKNNIELTSAKKDDIIEQILSNK